MRFRVEDAFWELFPGASVGVVIARGIDNSDAHEDAASFLLAQAVEQASSALSDVEDMASHPAVAPWREAYRTFGAKPSKYRSSIENLLRSVRAGGVRSINPLVDIYNAVSLKHIIPCGGEDLSAVVGDIRLTRAAGDESFIPLGSEGEQPPQPGEVIYLDDAGVLCRCLNWREAERTKLTPTTTDAVLCIEALPEIGEDRLRDACNELAALVRDKLGGTARVEILDRGHPEIEL